MNKQHTIDLSPRGRYDDAAAAAVVLRKMLSRGRLVVLVLLAVGD